VRFSNSLQLLLNLSDSFVLVLLSLLKSALDLLKLTLIDLSCVEQLIQLGFFGFNALFDRLELLLENKVLQTSLLMDLIDVVLEGSK
jgi:hypothetical protein